jgi:predicted RNase H-like HicB family nuclease
MLEVTEHPIMITLQDAITGDGFIARVTLCGRTLMRKEQDDKWWMYGVQPAGIAASGANVDEAFLRFRNRYKEILSDIALDSKGDFAAFKNEVERFYNEPDADDSDARAWEQALKAIRSEGSELPGEFSHLQRQSPEAKPCNIKVERADVVAKTKAAPFKSSDNVTDTYAYPMRRAA